MRLALSLIPVAAAVTAVVTGCGGASSPDANEGLACVMSGRGETYVVGLEHAGAGGMLDFKLMSAMPSPPAFSKNTWIVQINRMSGGVVGAPATGATLTVTPFMPDHQHGTLRVNVEAMPEAGHYRLTPIDMWMAGLWEVTIDADAGGVRDRVVYKFCIQA
jgi:YtkA-like